MPHGHGNAHAVVEPPTESAQMPVSIERKPRILLAATCVWPSTAKLATSLARDGAIVDAVSRRRHPLNSAAAVRRRYGYSAVRPLRSLAEAIRRGEPDLVIPCDERVTGHLHRLHAATRDPGVRALIERSLGSAETFPLTLARQSFMALCKRLGVAVPPFRTIHGVSDLRQWALGNPFPWVLKADGSWGGLGVRVVSTFEDAELAFKELSRTVALRFALRQLVRQQDPFWLASGLRRSKPSVTVQGYIHGRSANCAVAAWNGELLGGISARALSQAAETGPATVIELIDCPEMVEAAGRVVAAMKLSGLMGFDFIVEAATGAPYLIEMNARSTPTCHLQLGPGRDLTGALLARLTGNAVPDRVAMTTSNIVALFPNAWMQDPTHQLLRTAFHDVPWDDMGLAEAMLGKSRAWPRSISLQAFSQT